MLAEVTDFELWQRAVRDQFRQGESVGSLALGLGTLVAIVLVYAFLARAQAGLRRSKAQPQETHPQRLFTHLLCVLGLTATQRQFLESLARAAGLAHPTALLMSEELFNRTVDGFGADEAGKTMPMDRQSLDSLRARLFPQGMGMVQSRGVLAAGGRRPG